MSGCNHLRMDVMDDGEVRCRTCPQVFKTPGRVNWMKAACAAHGLEFKKQKAYEITPIVGAKEAYCLRVPDDA